MLSGYGIFVSEAAIKVRALTRLTTTTAAKAMIANGIQPPPAMMAKIKRLKRIGESRFSVSVVLLESMEKFTTGKDNQGAVG